MHDNDHQKYADQCMRFFSIKDQAVHLMLYVMGFLEKSPQCSLCTFIEQFQITTSKCVWHISLISISFIVALNLSLIICSSIFRGLSWQIHRLMHTNLAVEPKAHTFLKQEHFQRSRGLETMHEYEFLLYLPNYWW